MQMKVKRSIYFATLQGFIFETELYIVWLTFTQSYLGALFQDLINDPRTFSWTWFPEFYICRSFSNIHGVLQRVHEVLSISLTSGDMIIPSVQIGLLGSVTTIIQYQRTDTSTGL